MVKRGYTGRGGPINRPLRYPVKRTVKLSKDADNTLREMAEKGGKGVTVMLLIRRAVMKDIYIYKAEQKRHKEVEEELGPDDTQQ